MEKILIFDEVKATHYFHYEGSFNQEKMMQGIGIFLGAFEEGEDVVMMKLVDGKINRKFTAQEAKKMYENYPFRPLTDASEEDYHRQRLASLRFELLTYFTVKSEEELYNEIIEKL